MIHAFSWKSFSFLLVFAFIGFFAGCAAGPQEPDQPGPTVTTTIYGQVVDEAGAPVSAASVTSGTGVATSDANGLFVLKNAVVPQSRLVVLAKKAGYFTAARAETPKAGGATRTKLFLMSNTTTATVSSSAGGTVNVTGGGSVKFEAASFRTASGSAYSGTVKVAARYLDPAAPSFADFFAGDNLAQTADGGEAALISCGVLRVEVTGQNGEALTLDAAKPATITYPKPANNPSAPATMPLWYFDETLGLWKEEGSATLQSGKYVGTVTHFTDWNLDYNGEIGEVELRVICNGAPVQGVAVKVEGFFYKTAYSDEQGKVHFVRAPADKEMTILIRPEDNDGLYYITNPVKVTIAPNQLTDIGDITLNSPCPASLTGRLVDCDGKPIEGLVTIESGSDLSYTYTKSGAFSLQAKSGVAFVVKGMDANGSESIAVDVLPLLEGEVHTVGDITVCGPGGAGYFDIPLPSNSRGYVNIALSPDGSKIAVNLADQGSSLLSIYETAGGTVLSQLTLPAYTYYTMQFSADNQRLLCQGAGNYIVYDVSGSTINTLSSVTGSVSSNLYDDGTKVIAVISNGPTQDFKVFNASDGSLIKQIYPTITPSQDSVASLMLIQDEDAIIYADAGLWRIWSVGSDAESRNYTLPGIAYSARFSGNGSTIALSADWKVYSAYSTNTGTQIGTGFNFSAGGVGSNDYSAPAISNEYGYGASGKQSAIIIRAVKFSDGSSKVKLLPTTVTSLNGLAVSRGDEYLAAAHSNGVRVWKLK